MKSFSSASFSVINSIRTCKIAKAIFYGIEKPRETILWITLIFSSISLSANIGPSPWTNNVSCLTEWTKHAANY